MSEPVSRRSVLGSTLKLSGGLVAASAIGAGALAESVGADVPAGRVPFPDTPDAALARLIAGNKRFVQGRERAPRRSTPRRIALAEGQTPFAAILTCADSRVPPEIIFDQGLGDLFVVRVAGNTASDPLVIGSLEYAVAVLGSVLIFVLGHTECGAVSAAIYQVDDGDVPPGDIGAVVDPIVPAVEAVAGTPKDDLLDAATDENIMMAQAQLRTVPILAEAIAAGNLAVAGGEYQLETGKVQYLQSR
jgi:carbonic anhydrase